MLDSSNSDRQLPKHEAAIASRVGVIVLALTGASGAMLAQESTGHIEGRVLASGSTPAVSVRVTAVGLSLPLARVTATDTHGFFRLRDLPIGTYQVRLELVGYRPVVFEGVTAALGRATTVGEVSLQPLAIELTEIVVRADRPLVDMTSAATVTNLPVEQFIDLPTQRDFSSIVSLAPQANSSQLPEDGVNIAGATGPENAYFLDGANITDPYKTGTGAGLPFNFVQELEVKVGGYEAEFGRATGGIVNVVTRSGGNRFSGQAFGFFTDDALTAEPHFAAAGESETAFSEYDVGGSLGGPILKDRLWFFAAYDPSFRHEPVDVLGSHLPGDRTEHRYATKLTWQAGPSTDVVVTADGNPGRSHSVSDLLLGFDTLINAEAVTTLQHHGGVVLSGSVRRRLGGAAQAELSLSRFTSTGDASSSTALGRTEPHFTDLTTGVVSGGLGLSSQRQSVRTAARASVSATIGAHAVKFGAEYEDNRQDTNDDWSAQPGSPGGFINRVDDTTYKWIRYLARYSVHNRIPTFYAQDSWRPNPRLTLNYGVRWDAQYLIAPRGNVAQSFPDEWQPRLGFTYQLGTPGSQKVFGSYARFYEQVPLFLAAWDYNDAIHSTLLTYHHDPRTDPTGPVTAVSYFASAVARQDHLRGQSFDEITLGYERALWREYRVSVRGMLRTLRWAVEDGFDTTGAVIVGNPGRGVFAFAPRARRTYHALVVTLERAWGHRLDFLASYVFSRSRGNYDGLYDYLQGRAYPNATAGFDDPEGYRNSEGLLANDRPHTLKLSGSYKLGSGLSIGTAIAWISGRPRNEFGATPDARSVAFLQPRGAAGRTPALFDASLRITYTPRPWGADGPRPTLYLDVFHLGNQRLPLAYDDVHYSELDANGNQTTPNPDYGRALIFEPPTSARLGFSVDFGRGP